MSERTDGQDGSMASWTPDGGPPGAADRRAAAGSGGDPAAAALVLTTNPGLEDIALSELQERLRAAGHDPTAIRRGTTAVRGRLAVESDLPFETLLAVARTLRSVHNLLRPLAEFPMPEWEPVAGIAERAGALAAAAGLADGRRSFRVSSRRRGEHPFTSVELERAAGASVVAATGAPVDLEGYDVELRVDVIADVCTVGVRLTREALSHRYDRPYRQRVSLKANVAYAALRLAGVGAGTAHVLDPFCGSGTILLEAGALAPGATLWGGDRLGRAAEGTRRNLEAHGLGDRAQVFRVDAQAIDRYVPAGQIDAIVTNPPFGWRLGRDVRFFDFYRQILKTAHRTLRPGGRLAILAHRRDAFRAALRRARGFRMLHVRVIDTNGVWPALFVLERY